MPSKHAIQIVGERYCGHLRAGAYPPGPFVGPGAHSASLAMLPKVLVAVPQSALPFVETVLGGFVSLVPIHRFDDAIEMLRSECDLALILCGVHFDESRMYDLLRLARESQPHIPFVACRVLEARLSHISLQAIAIAAEALGAKAFVDLPTLILEFGRENAGPLFRSRVLASLGRGAVRSSA